MSLYENPLAAGAIPADAQVETACDDQIFGYLLGRLSDEPGLDLAQVESLPHVPPRAFTQVESLPHVPPRAFAQVESLPHVPPRAFAQVESLPHVPPRA
jgi:hypothetical protein